MGSGPEPQVSVNPSNPDSRTICGESLLPPASPPHAHVWSNRAYRLRGAQPPARVSPPLSPGPSRAQWSSSPLQPAQGQGASQTSQALGRTLHELEHQSPTCPSELGSKATFRRSLPDSPRTTKAPLLRGNCRGTLLNSHSAGFNYHVYLSG